MARRKLVEEDIRNTFAEASHPGHKFRHFVTAEEQKDGHSVHEAQCGNMTRLQADHGDVVGLNALIDKHALYNNLSAEAHYVYLAIKNAHWELLQGVQEHMILSTNAKARVKQASRMVPCASELILSKDLCDTALSVVIHEHTEQWPSLQIKIYKICLIDIQFIKVAPGSNYPRRNQH